MVAIELIICEYVEDFIENIMHNYTLRYDVRYKGSIGSFYKETYDKYLEWYNKYKGKFEVLISKEIMSSMVKYLELGKRCYMSPTDELDAIKHNRIFESLVEIQTEYIRKFFFPEYHSDNDDEFMMYHRVYAVIFMICIKEKRFLVHTFEPSMGEYTKINRLYKRMLFDAYFKKYISYNLLNEISEYIFI